jgi:hypothetical protein
VEPHWESGGAAHAQVIGKDYTGLGMRSIHKGPTFLPEAGFNWRFATFFQKVYIMDNTTKNVKPTWFSVR